MTMTREEMQRLASYGRDGDTMLAHINPKEAALLKQSGGSGTINPNTGLPEYRFGGKLTGGVKSVASIPVAAVNNPVAAIKSVAAPVVEPVSTLAQRGAASAENAIDTLKKAAASGGFIDSGGGGLISSITNPLQKAVSQVSSNISNLPGSVANTAQQVTKPVVNFLKTPEGQIALALALPSMGTAITTAFPAISSTVATAMASTAVQVAQGVPFETALQNATVNAVTSTGSPKVATEINNLVKIPAISDAITSAGASALKTGLAGGTQEDIKRNILAGLTGSGVASAVDAYTKDVTASESAQLANKDLARQAGATVGGAVAGGTQGALTGLAGTLASQDERNKQLAEDLKGTKLAMAGDGTMTDAGPTLSDVRVVAPRPVEDTNIISPDVSLKPKTTTSSTTPKTSAQPLSTVTVTANRPIEDTNIIEPDTPITTPDETSPQPKPEPGKPPVDAQGKYDPNLFIYGGKSPSTLGTTLKTSAPFYPVAGTTGGLTSTRGAGEIESKETGKARKNVWNEASLRLKDALGV